MISSPKPRNSYLKTDRKQKRIMGPDSIIKIKTFQRVISLKSLYFQPFSELSRGLTPRPPPYQGDALPTAPKQHSMKLLLPVRISLPKSYNSLSVLPRFYLMLRETLYFSGVLFTASRPFSLFTAILPTKF